MSTAEFREFAIRAVECKRGDDLYRARKAFAGMTAMEMQQEHGQSGKTRAEILAACEAHDAKCNAVIDWLLGLA